MSEKQETACENDERNIVKFDEVYEKSYTFFPECVIIACVSFFSDIFAGEDGLNAADRMIRHAVSRKAYHLGKSTAYIRNRRISQC